MITSKENKAKSSMIDSKKIPGKTKNFFNGEKAMCE